MLSGFVLISALAFLFPPNGDDWAWGSQIGLDRLHTFFTDYNGRYAANLLVLALTRLPIVAPLVIGATLMAVLYLALDITHNRTRWGYALTTALLLAMPHALWSQTVSWVSGFTNYTLSALWILVYLKVVQADWSRQDRRRSPWLRALLIVPSAFVMSLFMENVTIFFAVVSVIVLVAQRRVRRRVSADAWYWAIGFWAGAVAMFSNGAYRNAVQGTAYQQFTGLRGLAKKLLDPISRFTIVENVALNIALATAIGIVAVLTLRRGERARGFILAGLAVAFLATAIPVAMALQEGVLTPPERRFAGLPAVLGLAALCAVTFLGIRQPRQRMLAAGLLAAGALLLAPLFVVYPLGPRSFFPTYILMLMILNVLLRGAFEQVDHAPRLSVGVLGVVVTIALMSSYFVVYVPMAIASRDRVDYIRQQVAAGARTVVVDRLPYGSYTHMPDPTPARWASRYLLYYGLPPDVTIKLAPRG